MKFILLAALAFAPFVAHAQQTVPVSVRDPLLNNMVAWTGTIPAGWHFQGTVQRLGEGGVGQVLYRISSPDNSIVEETYPWIITTDVPGQQMNVVVCPRTSTLDILRKYIAPRLLPGAKDLNDSTHIAPKDMGNGTTFDINLISLGVNQDGHTVTKGLRGATIYSPRPGGHYFAITAITIFSNPGGREREVKPLFSLKSEVTQQWLQADHQQNMAYFQAKSNAISAQGNSAILAEADRQRSSQNAIFASSMANAANSQHAIDESTQGTIDNIRNRTRVFVWRNPNTGETTTTTTSYAPAGGPWVNVPPQ